jgi:nucleotide sugar dehydrogenase
MADDFDDYAPEKPTGEGQAEPIGRNNPLRMGIVGHGFVGQAVEYAFYHPMVEHFLVDPKHDTSIDDLIKWKPQVAFICAPTPQNPDSGFVDASIVEDAVLKLIYHTNAFVVVKSTITPDIVDRLYNSIEPEDFDRFIYNPEFLTEKSACEDFVNAEHHVFGGTAPACDELGQLYDIFSNCKSDKYYRMSGCEASFVKYATNAYLATKLTFFNQLKDLVDSFDCSYNMVTRAMGADDRIGIKHTRVPGPDKKKGFGGACLPKDTMALLKFSETRGEKNRFDLLENVLTINNGYRIMYELDQREKVNNITFGDAHEHNGQTQEELETQDDGSTVGV